MKLAKIEHERCNEPSGSSLVWIPDEMAEDELMGLVDKAIRAALDAEAAFSGSAPPQPGYSPTVHQADRSKTVEQVWQEWEARKVAWEQYAAKCAAARKGLVTWLVEISEGKIRKFWDDEDGWIMKVTANWGHNHGKRPDYEETELA